MIIEVFVSKKAKNSDWPPTGVMRLLFQGTLEVCVVGKGIVSYFESCEREIISTLRELENISWKW